MSSGAKALPVVERLVHTSLPEAARRELVLLRARPQVPPAARPSVGDAALTAASMSSTSMSSLCLSSTGLSTTRRRLTPLTLPHHLCVRS